MNNNNKKRSPAMTILLRSLLVFFTVIVLAIGGLSMILNLIFNGPSESARDVLTMSLLEASATKWVPGLFLGSEKVEQIRADAGLDIGLTLIGMHLKQVAVPVRLEHNRIGEALVVAARTRPKFIGGCRAAYDETLL